jgi:geranylgeranyl diphosphate synthase type I
MDFAESLKHYQRSVEKRLVAFLERKRRAYSGREAERWVYDVLGDFLLRGGKRLRAIMTVTAYEGATGEFGDPRIIDASCALEFLDAYFLVQDDVIDLSDLRRGGPSAHVMLADYATNIRSIPPEEAQLFGYNVAVGVGDIFNAWGIECLLHSHFPAERRLAAIATYNSACEMICRGEIKDIYLGLSTVTATQDDYVDMILQKTGYYVTRAPALIGLDLAGASDQLREAMVAFAEPIGLAFQIRDDILDLLSTEEELGKPIGTDLREGKDTLIIIHAREAAAPEQWARIREVLGNHGATAKQIMQVREVLEEVGAFAYAEHCMHDHVTQAHEGLGQLAALGLREETVGFYEEMVEFIGSRRH